MIEELYKELRVVLTLKPELETLVIFSSVKRFSLRRLNCRWLKPINGAAKIAPVRPE